MSAVLIFSKPIQQGAKIHFVWAVKQSIKGLWHQIGGPCLFLVSGASQPSGKKWAVMIHHKLFVRYNTERYGCSPPLCISPLLLQHDVSQPITFFIIWRETQNKNGNTKLGSCSAGCQISLSAPASWEQCGFSKQFVLSWRILCLNFTGCTRLLQ